MKDYPYHAGSCENIHMYFRSIISCEFCVKTQKKKKGSNSDVLQQSTNMKTSIFKFFCKQKTRITEPQNMSRVCAYLFTFVLHRILGLSLSLYLHSVRHAEKGVCLFAFLTFGIFGTNEGRTSDSLNTFLVMKHLPSDSLMWCVEEARILVKQTSCIS